MINFFTVITGIILITLACLTSVVWEKCVIIYFALSFWSYPLMQFKMFIFKYLGVIFFLPHFLLNFLLPLIDIIMLPIVYIYIVLGAIVMILNHTIGTLNINLIMYIAFTLTSIIAVLPFSERVIEWSINKLRKKDNGFYLCDKWYHPHVIRYIIYVIYFVLLAVGNICEYSDVYVSTQNTVLLKSFLTFLAFDRLIANKSIFNKLSMSYLKEKIVRSFELTIEKILHQKK